MIEIARLDDSRTADYAHVGDPSWLRTHRVFVAEGRLVVRRLLEEARFTVRSVLVTPSAFSALEDVLASAPCPVYVCQQDTLAALSGIDFHRGCLAIAERPSSLVTLAQFADSRRLLAIEGVSNPDNVGGLFRVAAAFAAAGVLLDASSGDPLYRKAIRTSMAATLQLPFARLGAWRADLETLRVNGWHLIALTPDATATSLSRYAAALTPAQRLVVIVGSEGAGLSPATMTMADARVRIPIAAGVDSLNVVVAAGIALAALSGM